MNGILIVLVAVAAVSGASAELPAAARFRGRPAPVRSNARFARIEEAPAAPQPESSGYDYPKPMTGGYQYPKPEQGFPLPGESSPVAPTTESTEGTTTEQPETTTASFEDYDDGVTGEPAPEDANPVRLSAPRRRQRLQRLQRLEDLSSSRGQPIYLVNLPESTLQRLILVNNADAAVAAVPTVPAQPIYLTGVDFVYGKK